MANYSRSAMKSVYSLLAALLLASGAMAADESKAPPEHARGPEALQPHEGADGATLWLNPADWTWVKSDNADSKVFVFRTGLAQVRLLSNDEPSTNEALLEGLLERLRKIDPEPDLRFQEVRRVNGVDMLCVQVSVSDQKRNVVYYGLLHGDADGSTELFAVTWLELLGNYYEDLTLALDGLEVSAAAEEKP